MYPFVSKMGKKREDERQNAMPPAQISPPPTRSAAAPPPLPPRKRAVGQRSPIGSFAVPPYTGLNPNTPQTLQNYSTPPDPAVSPPPVTNLSLPSALLQRSPSPQTLQVQQRTISGDILIPQRSPSPNAYPAPQPTAPSPRPSPRLTASPGPAVRSAAKREPPKVRKILSLDGGGVRGLSIIRILKYIMQEVNRERGLESTPLDPWQEFDMIGGTSTGG